MSRFFANAYDYESASSSEEEDLLSSSEEELMSSSSSEAESEDSFFDESESESDVDSDGSDGSPYGPDWFKKPEFRKGGAQSSGANKFLKNASYSDSDESDDEGKKVVKSAKDKLLDEMRNVYNKIDVAEMTQDWIQILNEFDNMSRLLTRAQQQNYGTPNIFIKVVAQVEDAVAATSQSEIKNKAIARAYNTIRQRVKKVARENETLLNKFRETPEAFDNDASVDMEGSQENGAASLFALAGKKGADLSSVATASSESDFFTALRIVIDSRGKKGTDHHAQVKTMEELLEIAKSPYEKIVAYLNLIPIRFDASATLSYQPLDQWKAAHEDIVQLLNTLETNISTYHVTELAPVNENIEEEPQANENGVKQILGSVFSFIERLDDEFNKSLLNTDPHSSDFLDRLRDEQSVYNLILRSQLYLESVLPEEDKEKNLSRVLTRRLDHIYYKPTKLVEIIETNAWKSVPNGAKSLFSTLEGEANATYIFQLVDLLCGVLCKQKDAALRKRASLYQVYFYALNSEFQKAKQMLLSSNIQSSINNADPSLQILFNRAVVQLGLAAFKLCLIDDCHQILNEVSTSTHLRDILGQQSLQRASSNSIQGTTSSTEQLCLPFHQHINLDLIDVVFMTCSLLIEVPHMAAFFSGIKVKRIPYSQKSIRRALEHYEKSSFQGPPETLRDHVLYAAKSMQKGDWEKSVKYLRAIPTWALLPKSDEMLDNLTERVQVESLRTYIFTFKRFYSKLAIKKLSELFGLSEEKVIEIVEGIIAEYDIKGSLNEEKTCIVFEKGYEITKLEEVAVKLAKEAKYVSERLNEKKFGSNTGDRSNDKKFGSNSAQRKQD
ncbi:LAFE_0E14642g1_1 [Lachancea fermentati]|uniref:Eukaryotic translation initiation factor 3 subunit C n=1 Tax=Lachancea fermentati TaxID=4955 RepID=A0A1G4MED2_LACFM|nr:LAFE_0E14642g1_1 [Lachancea fermentati]